MFLIIYKLHLYHHLCITMHYKNNNTIKLYLYFFLIAYFEKRWEPNCGFIIIIIVYYYFVKILIECVCVCVCVGGGGGGGVMFFKLILKWEKWMQIHDFFSNKIINYKTLSYDILIGLYVHIVLMFSRINWNRIGSNSRIGLKHISSIFIWPSNSSNLYSNSML